MLFFCFFFFGKISVIVQIEFVKTEKIEAIQLTEVNFCQYARNNYKQTTGVTVSGSTDIKLIKEVFICVAYKGVGAYFVQRLVTSSMTEKN